jgi:hypothetical protein
MTHPSRLILVVVALLFFCGTSNAAGLLIVKDYSFAQVNGKTLPIPGGLPEVCNGSVSGWPFVGFGNGGIFLPAQPAPIAAIVALQGQDSFVRAAFGNFCIHDGSRVLVEYCISTPTQGCNRPRVKFIFRTKEAVMGDRG